MNTRRAKNLRGKETVVITGTGAVCPFGNSTMEIWNFLAGGNPSQEFLSADSKKPFYPELLRTWKAPALKTEIQPQLARSMGKHLMLLLLSAEESHAMSCLGGSGLKGEDIGFFAGMGMVDYHVDDLIPAVLKSCSTEGELDYGKFFSGGFQEIYPLWPLAMLNNVAFCQVAIHLKLHGENCVFTPHADAGVQAISESVKVLREGKAAAVLVGGVSEEVSPLSLARAELNGLTGSPVFLGECGATLALETLALAEKRHIRPLAAIAGFGFACGGDGRSPTSRTIYSSMNRAVSAAGLEPGDIDLVIAGAVGLPETRACNAAAMDFFGGRIPVWLSPGHVFGEIFAASPILNTIIGTLIFESSKLPEVLLPAEVGNSENGSKLSLAPEKVLIIATSYEGRCAAFVLEKLPADSNAA